MCLFLQMPQLKPETISMTGLNLFQHLCNLARLATSTLDNTSSCEVHAPSKAKAAGVFQRSASHGHVFPSPVVWDGPALGDRSASSVG